MFHICFILQLQSTPQVTNAANVSQTASQQVASSSYVHQSAKTTAASTVPSTQKKVKSKTKTSVAEAPFNAYAQYATLPTTVQSQVTAQTVAGTPQVLQNYQYSTQAGTYNPYGYYYPSQVVPTAVAAPTGVVAPAAAQPQVASQAVTVATQAAAVASTAATAVSNPLATFNWNVLQAGLVPPPPPKQEPKKPPPPPPVTQKY